MSSPLPIPLPPARLVRKLRRRWSSLDAIERGEQIRNLVDRGFSRHALAQALGCSECTIRRYLKLAALPETTRVAIQAGMSAKHVLRLLSAGQSLPAINEDQKRRFLEDRLVASCLQQARPWLARLLPWSSYQEQFLTEAEVRLWHLRSRTTPARTATGAMRLALARFRPKRQQPSYGTDLLEYALEWFLTWVIHALPVSGLQDHLLKSLGQTWCREGRA